MKRTSSEARIAANRANSKGSTGPRTAEGKASTSRNALIHGLTASLTHSLTAKDLTALGEDLDLLPSILEDHLRSWSPSTPFEATLVKRLAELQIRLDRCTRMETGLLDPNIPPITRTDTTPTINSAIAQAFTEREASFMNLSRYESNLSRTYDRTLKQLLASRKEKLILAPEPISAPHPDETKPILVEKKETLPSENLQIAQRHDPEAQAASCDLKKNRRFDTFIPPPPLVKEPVELVWLDADGNEYELGPPREPRD